MTGPDKSFKHRTVGHDLYQPMIFNWSILQVSVLLQHKVACLLQLVYTKVIMPSED